MYTYIYIYIHLYIYLNILCIYIYIYVHMCRYYVCRGPLPSDPGWALGSRRRARWSLVQPEGRALPYRLRERRARRLCPRARSQRAVRTLAIPVIFPGELFHPPSPPAPPLAVGGRRVERTVCAPVTCSQEPLPPPPAAGGRTVSAVAVL